MKVLLALFIVFLFCATRAVAQVADNNRVVIPPPVAPPSESNSLQLNNIESSTTTKTENGEKIEFKFKEESSEPSEPNQTTTQEIFNNSEIQEQEVAVTKTPEHVDQTGKDNNRVVIPAKPKQTSIIKFFSEAVAAVSGFLSSLF